MPREVEFDFHGPERGAARKILLFIVETTIRSGSIQLIEPELNQPIQPTHQRITRIPSKQRR